MVNKRYRASVWVDKCIFGYEMSPVAAYTTLSHIQWVAKARAWAYARMFVAINPLGEATLIMGHKPPRFEDHDGKTHIGSFS